MPPLSHMMRRLLFPGYNSQIRVVISPDARAYLYANRGYAIAPYEHLEEGQRAAARMYVKCTAVRLALHVVCGDRYTPVADSNRRSAVRLDCRILGELRSLLASNIERASGHDDPSSTGPTP